MILEFMYKVETAIVLSSYHSACPSLNDGDLEVSRRIVKRGEEVDCPAGREGISEKGAPTPMAPLLSAMRTLVCVQ